MIKVLASFIQKRDYLAFKIFVCVCLFMMGLSIGKLTLVFAVLLLLGAAGFVVITRKDLLNVIKRVNISMLVFATFVFFATLANCIWKISDFFKNVYHYLILPTFFFTLGEESARRKRTKFFIFALSSFYFGQFIFAFLSLSYTISVFGMNVANMPRLYYTFYNHESVSCTGLSLLLINSCLLSSIGLFLKAKKFYTKIAFVLIVLFAIGFSAAFGNRGFFVAYFIAVVGIIFIYLFNYDAPKKIKIIFLSIGGAFVLFVAFLYISIFANFQPIIKLIREIPVLERFFEGGSNSERMQIYKNFFSVFYKYPFGGMYQTKALEISNFTHNSWLDVYCSSGLIPFICFTYLTGYFMIRYCFSKRAVTSKNEHIAISALFMGCVSISLFEPTIHGNMYFFLTFFAFFGYISASQKPVIYLDKKLKEADEAELVNEKKNYYSVNI